ncbi:MAG TPA: YoaK family protein [Stellaceae bacterium]|nr:YoaK family protein [Stellaceae bacterium]
MAAFARVGVAIALTVVAGSVDAIGWLSLNRVFTAQMSGNLVLLAVHIAAGEESHIWLQADALAAFLLGLLMTGAAIEIGVRRRHRRIFMVALAVEFAMLAAFAACATAFGISDSGAVPAGPIVYGLVALAAFAMGAQNTSIRMARILSVYTTHMTGALTGLGEALVAAALPLGAASGRERHAGVLATIAQSLALLLGFIAGALAGAWLLKIAGLAAAMSLPLALLVLAAVVDGVAPLTRFDEAAAP